MTFPIPAEGASLAWPSAAPPATPPTPDEVVAAAFREALTFALGEAPVPAAPPQRRLATEGTTTQALPDVADTPTVTLAEGETRPPVDVVPADPGPTPRVPPDGDAMAQPTMASPPPRPGHAPASREAQPPVAFTSMLTADAEATEGLPTQDLAPRSDDASEDSVATFVVAPLALPLPPTLPRAVTAPAVRDDIDLLVPEFRGRLERVIERMEREFGVTVEVVETVRSQDRQDTLYEQGRVTPGPVVTWTRASRHTTGLAADVTVNGGWTDRAAFARLADVALEEGLRTLGTRDPGHIELPVAGGTSVQAADTEASTPVGRAQARFAGPTDAPSPTTWPTAVRAGTEGDQARTAPGPRPQATFPSPQAALASQLRPFGDAVASVDTPVEVSWRALPLLPDEFTTDARTAIAPAVRERGADAFRAAPAPVAFVAPVATVARVAQVASVASLGRTAEPATRHRSTDGGGRATVESRAATEASTIAATLLAEADDVLVATAVRAPAEGATRDFRGDTSRERGQLPALAADTGRDAVSTESLALGLQAPEIDADLVRAALGEGRGTMTDGTHEAPVAGAIERTDASERIARALRVQEALGDRSVSSVVLRLDLPEGGEDRIRIDLRGRSIGTTLDIADARAADHLRAHATELQQALERRGLDGEGIVVRAATDAATSVATAAAGERDSVRAAGAQGQAGAGANGREQRTPREGPAGGHPRNQDQPASRQRRDHGGQRR